MAVCRVEDTYYAKWLGVLCNPCLSFPGVLGVHGDP